MRRNLIPLAVAAVIGCGFAGYAYFAEGTGVTGSEGALLALVGSLAVALGILLAASMARRGVSFGILVFLAALGSLLTAVAGVFLMQYGLAVAMALTWVGLTVLAIFPQFAKRSA